MAGKFSGEGLNFKAKLIGIADVEAPRGDQMCMDAIAKLKADIKSAGTHKQKITIKVTLGGLEVLEEKSQALQYTHPVHKISFIARDPSDLRAFGYIYGSPDGSHKFFAIKTAQNADALVLTIKELFETVYAMKVEERERTVTAASEREASLSRNIPNGGGEGSGGDSNAAATAAATANQFEGTLVNLDIEIESIRQGIDSIESEFSSLSSPMSGGDPWGATKEERDKTEEDLFASTFDKPTEAASTADPFASNSTTHDPFAPAEPSAAGSTTTASADLFGAAASSPTTTAADPFAAPALPARPAAQPLLAAPPPAKPRRQQQEQPAAAAAATDDPFSGGLFS